jgi:hypothetical protein
MIRTVAGLLDSLKHREMEIIARSGIRHAPTIGAQYEGLTSDLLRRMITVLVRLGSWPFSSRSPNV